ncbi:MAG: YihY/virulence factor BrkB family protein [Deltaproteobacteria bacterium]|nr:YihY/virulence factor BrkB family protein [Deltaproteobacteria bacterium]MDQ3297438.1 YihY/virulence factor BrkB family protein [Myxococcota bacterium]
MRFLIRAQAWLNTSDRVVAHWLRAARDALLGEMPILAGGTALFAIFAVVPTLAAAVAIYGVVADPGEINSHVGGLSSVLPGQVVAFIAEQLERQAKSSSRELGLALAASVLIAVISARGAARALIDTLNRAYRVRERRRPIVKLAVTIAMAGGTLVGLMLMFGVVVALPAIFALLRLDGYAVVQWLRWPPLMSVMFLSLVALYRFGPSPRDLGSDRHLWPGAVISTVLLVVLSIALSQWVNNVATYDLWYGAFGSAVIILLWFYLSVIAIVLGGFVNAELERHAGAPAPERSMY